MFSDHLEVDPALAVDELGPTDVVDVLPPFGAVVAALVVEADHRLVVSHIDERPTPSVGDLDLDPRRWRSAIFGRQLECVVSRNPGRSCQGVKATAPSRSR
jgi:hypothetical protein